MVLLLWAGATGVDVGFSVYGSRQAQAMADTAALDLARYISYADTLSSINQVQSYLNDKLADVDKDNGSNAGLTVVPGYYANGTFTADGYQGLGCQPTLAPQVRPGCNAVEVTASQAVPQIFFGGFNSLNGHASANANGSSIVEYAPESAFSIGTYLANVNTSSATALQQSKVLNAVWSPLDSGVNLTLVGYQGLAQANLTLAQLISASGNLLSPTNIMTASLTAAQWQSIYLSAVASVYGSSSSAYTTLQALDASNSSSTDVQFCQMANINFAGTVSNCSSPSLAPQGLNASVNVFQMLSTEAELANGTNGIDITSALNLTDGLLSIGSVKLSLQVIQPAQYGFGPVGTTVPTAQVTSSLSMNLSTLGVQLGTLTIPLSAASGTATLASDTCVDNAMTSTSITGNTTALSTNVSLTLAGIATTVGSLSISGVSNASAPFSSGVVPPTAATQAAGTNAYNIGTQTPTLSFSANTGINALVAGLLSSTSVLAEAYGPVLQALGVTVAGAAIEDYNTWCDAIQLVS